MKRRDFLWLLGVMSGTGALSACGSRKKQARLVSYLLPPEEGVIPGVADFRPATCTECPAGCGTIVRVREGRPVKLEGVPGHPVSDGGLCVRGQSSLYRLYHPERLRSPMEKSGATHRPITWEKALARVADAVKGSREEGRGNLFLSGRTTGSLSRLIDAFCAKAGVERLPEFEVYAHSAVREANGLLFGERDVPRYRIDEADFLLTVGADVIETHVSPVGYTRMISRARSRPEFRWVHVEPHFSLTGANADRRFAVAPGRERVLLSFLLRESVERRASKNRAPQEVLATLPPVTAETVVRETGLSAEAVKEIADGLIAAKRPLLIVGGVSAAHPAGLSAAAAAALIQWAAGGVPELVDFAASENYRTVGTFRDMEEMSARMAKGEAGVIFLLRTNPVFSLPPRLAFRENLGKAKLSVALCDLLDETAREADLVIPLSHSLESWGDVEPRRGVTSLLQPVLPSLNDTRSDGDTLLGLLGTISGDGPPGSYQDLLFAAWGKRLGEAGRNRLLEKGYVEEAVPSKAVSLNATGAIAAFKGAESESDEAGAPVLILAPSLRTFDGRSRPLTLLSEIPDPLTTISYGPWISVSEETAKRSGLADGDEVTIASPDWKAVLPVKVQPGLPDGVFVAHRDSLSSPPVRTDGKTGGPWDYIPGIGIAKTGKKMGAPILSGSFSQEGRGLIPDPVHREPGRHKRWTLYPEHEHPEYRWAMAIDLSLCNGCSACVAACYVENNVPIAGKVDHLNGREMSWLRIEPFYENGKVEFLPMLCQHCDNAPCEPVCPVFAAYHNPEGLNAQIYARCVGTRYCSNNCPYKVRRFNWWSRRQEPSGLILNPDVPARDVGIMEKCTFCVQRIRAAKDKAKDEGRKVRDGEFTTACAQSCPTGAIVFGNMLDTESRVHRLAHSGRAHRVFEELGTEPSIHYLSAGKDGQGK